MENRASAKGNGEIIAKKSQPAIKAAKISWMEDFWFLVSTYFYMWTYFTLGVCLFFYVAKYSRIVDCIMESFQNASQLNDPVYGGQVSQYCWTYGIHPDNYMRYDKNETTIYLSKHTKSNRRPIEFYQRQSMETQYLREQSWTVVGNLFGQTVLFVISLAFLGYPLIKKIIDILNFGCLLYLFSVLKLITYGQYSSKLGLRYEDLFTFFQEHLVVDPVPANFTRSTFAQEDVNLVNPVAFPGKDYSFVSLIFFLAILAFVHLIQLVRLIVRKIRTAKRAKNSTTRLTRSNSGNNGSSIKPATETTTKSVSSESKPANASISTEGDSACKSSENHVITIGETEI